MLVAVLILTQLFDCSENTSSLLILQHMRVWRNLPYKKLGRVGGITSVGWKWLITYRIQETKHGWRATDPRDAYQKIVMFLLTIGILRMQWYVLSNFKFFFFKMCLICVFGFHYCHVVNVMVISNQRTCFTLLIVAWKLWLNKVGDLR